MDWTYDNVREIEDLVRLAKAKRRVLG